MLCMNRRGPPLRSQLVLARESRPASQLTRIVHQCRLEACQVPRQKAFHHPFWFALRAVFRVHLIPLSPMKHHANCKMHRPSEHWSKKAFQGNMPRRKWAYARGRRRVYLQWSKSRMLIPRQSKQAHPLSWKSPIWVPKTHGWNQNWDSRESLPAQRDRTTKWGDRAGPQRSRQRRACTETLICDWILAERKIVPYPQALILTPLVDFRELEWIEA